MISGDNRYGSREAKVEVLDSCSKDRAHYWRTLACSSQPRDIMHFSTTAESRHKQWIP